MQFATHIHFVIYYNCNKLNQKKFIDVVCRKFETKIYILCICIYFSSKSNCHLNLEKNEIHIQKGIIMTDTNTDFNYIIQLFLLDLSVNFMCEMRKNIIHDHPFKKIFKNIN